MNVEIVFNGETRQIIAGTTVAALLTEMQLNPRYLAVELNLAVVPRAQHGQRLLQSGDCLEVVTLVGGG